MRPSKVCGPSSVFDLSECLLALDKDKLTKKKIKEVVLKVMAWRRVAEFLCETLGGAMDAEERIEEMENELGRLMVGLDQKVKPHAESRSSRRNTDSDKNLIHVLCYLRFCFLE